MKSWNFLVKSVAAGLAVALFTSGIHAGTSQTMNEILSHLNRAIAMTRQSAASGQASPREDVALLLQTIADKLETVEDHGRARAIDFRVYAEAMRRAAESIQTNQTLGPDSGLQKELAGIVELCSGCHSRLDTGELVGDANR